MTGKTEAMERGQGAIQRRIIVALAERQKSPRELASEIYGKEILPKHIAGIRQALRSMVKLGLVKRSEVFTTDDGSWCWLLTGAQAREPQRRHLKSV